MMAKLASLGTWLARAGVGAWRWLTGKIHGYPDLLKELTDLREKVRERDDTIDDLRARLRVHEQHAAIEGSFEYRRGVYWSTDEAAADPGPFCPNCWNRDHVRIHPRPIVGGHYCYQCKSSFPDPDSPTRKERRPPRGGGRSWARD